MARNSSLCVIAILCSVQAKAIAVTTQTLPETCGNVNGHAWCTVTGGQAPYTYAWTGPNGFTASVDSLYDLDAGVYTITVTDNLGATASSNAVVDDLTSLPSGYGPTYAGAMPVTGYWGGACDGECNGAGAFYDGMNGGTAPFSYYFSSPATYLGMNTSMDAPVYGGFCLGDQVSYTMVDALGCTGNGYFIVYGVDDSWNPQVQEVQGACSGGTNGSITVLAQGPMGGLLTLTLNGSVVATQNAGIASLHTFTALGPGDYVLEEAHYNTMCSTSQTITVPDLGPDCGSLNGTSWYDMDQDCVHDPGEVPIAGQVLWIGPGEQYAITHSDGGYLLNLPAGAYTLAETDTTLVPVCPATLPVAFTINGAPVTIDLANTSTVPLDLTLMAVNNAARPGFAHSMWANVHNTSPQVSGPVTLSCTFDPVLTFTNAMPAPNSVIGNTLTWDLPSLGSFGSEEVQVVFNVPLGTPLGTLLNSTWSVSNTLPESNAGNNSSSLTRAVTGSWDPNVKEVRTSSGQSASQYFIGTDDLLEYIVQFQNTGTDTAFTVVITDTLSSDLDMATFVQGPSSHPCTVDFLHDRVVRWTFNGILLPDSATDAEASHGLTSFRIRPRQPVQPGILITNKADIFFDLNAPVRTPDATVVTELSTGIATSGTEPVHMYPNPAQDLVTIITAMPVRARIRSMDGRTVKERLLPAGAVGLDLGGCTAGSYLIELIDTIGQVFVSRLIKR